MFRTRVFTGPDGREYLWRPSKKKVQGKTSGVCKYKQTRLTGIIELFVNDSAKMPVARFHPRGLGVIGERPLLH